ncbi:hypothetical protein HOD19_03205 [bacterium]|jgi:hypothetical protein|nr:hypothetical protein [bacterium]MBT4649213.1 hypothetical protein [bacterium]
MEALLDWKLLVIAIVINTVYVLVILFAQRVESNSGKLMKRHDIIPGTHQIFLYWQDFTTQAGGNSLLMPFILYVFIWKTAHQSFPPSIWPWLIGVAIIDMILFATMCLAKNHKPDWGYPSQGKMSVGGFLHLLYHGSYMAIILASLYSVVIDWEVVPGILLITCLAIYLVFAQLDYRFGYFEKLKKITQ